ncbi:MAG: 50S ribosomal protein L14 [Candidatus Pacebacteria bacterium]|nr:50S ribosomal protein L14 [Candidatus Paceibacterota bacterium]
MIQPHTKLNVADNTGAKLVQCIQLPGGTRKKYARIGDVVVAAVKKAEPRRETKEHQVVKVVIVRQKSPFRRKDGSYIRFDDNACCILNEQKQPKGNRILGPVPRELREKGFDAIITMAKDVV